MQDRGETAAAERLFREVLAMREKLLGPDHFEVAVSLNSLAWLLASTETPEAAEPLYRRSLAILEQRLGDEHPEVASVTDHLAFLLTSRLGRHGRAEELARRALAMQRRLLQADHPHLARSSTTLAPALEGWAIAPAPRRRPGKRSPCSSGWRSPTTGAGGPWRCASSARLWAPGRQPLHGDSVKETRAPQRFCCTTILLPHDRDKLRPDARR